MVWWAQVDSNHRPRAYQARALTTWAMSPCKFSVYLVPSSTAFVSSLTGGDDGNRTHDPLLAGQVLSQLSYTPKLRYEVKGKSEEVTTLVVSLSLYYPVTYGHSKLNNNRLILCASLLYLIVRKKSTFIFGFGLLLNYELSVTPLLLLTFSIERRWSSRTFRYGYLVTT